MKKIRIDIETPLKKEKIKVKTRTGKEKVKERTLYWLAKESGLPYPTILRLRDGQMKSISFDVLSKIITTLDCGVADILKVENTEPPGG